MPVTATHQAHVAPSCGNNLLWSVVHRILIDACVLKLDSFQTGMFRGTLHSQNNESLMSASVHPSSGEGEEQQCNMIPMTVHLQVHQ